MKLTPSEPDITTLVARIDRGDIDLQPDFQRQEVWSVRKKKKLIDTVLRGWSIPPIHLVILSDGQSEVLDGQQRLAAIRDFVHNRFSIDGNVTPVNEEISALHGKFYRNLDDATRRRVDQYPLRAFRITEYSPEEPSELFYRLNQPTGLTAGEQRNALYGPAREQMKHLVNLFEEQGNEKSTLGFSNLRLAYDDIIARLIFFVEASSFGVKSTEQRISERFRRDEPFDDFVLEASQFSINAFSTMREAANPYRFNKASVLSWLLFLSRFASSGDLNFDFMAMVFSLEEDDGRTIETQAIEIFNDRASSRVTDVSSVVLRDFCLCFLFDALTHNALPAQVDKDAIRTIREATNSRDGLRLEPTISEHLNIDEWSTSL